MKGTAIVLDPGETLQTATRVHFSTSPGLEFLQKAVKGSIEAVPCFERALIDGELKERVVVFCNEEGKLEGLPVNRTATTMWMSEFNPDASHIDDVLVGPVVILFGDEEFMEEI